MKDLTNKKILFIICGGISAYKSLETIRLLKKDNAEVKTILTKSAKNLLLLYQLHPCPKVRFMRTFLM